jgi:uncharacterized protein YdaU (DUF1376 family)
MSASTRLPYFKHYISDDIEETEYLSIAATGAFHRLQIKFFQVGELPTNDEKIQRLLKWPANDRKWPAIRDELKEHVFSNDWLNPRWEAVLERSREKSENNAKSAKTRWSRPAAAPPPERYEGPEDGPEEAPDWTN